MTTPQGSGGGADPANVPPPNPSPGAGNAPGGNAPGGPRFGRHAGGGNAGGGNAAGGKAGIGSPGIGPAGAGNAGGGNAANGSGADGNAGAGNAGAGSAAPGNAGGSAGGASSDTVPPDQARAKQVDSAQQFWANPGADSQEEQARIREDLLSGRLTDPGRPGGAAGDTNIFFDFRGRNGSTLRAYRLPRELIRQPFALPSGFGALDAAASQGKPLLVVRGREGIGKRAALIRALTRGDDSMVVLILSADTSLRALDPASLPTCQALVLEDLTAEHLAQLDGFTVERLTADLAMSGRWLGLTIADLQTPQSLDAAVLDLGDPPPARTVFELHLRSGALDGQACDVITRQVADQFDDGILALRRVAEAGRKLAEKDSVPNDVVEFVREKLDAQYECVQWFRALPDLRARCMALSLAVLDGLPREQVSNARDRLVELTGARARVRDPLAPDADVSLRTLRARTEPGTLFATEGDVPVMVLRYDDSKYPHWILEYAWNQLDTARPHIVTWLRELGGNGNLDVRTAAAVTVGLLSRTAFAFLYPRIIAEWAESEYFVQRESAMRALVPPSRDANLRATVDGLVQSWTVAADRPLQQATAARTFGTEVGRARFFRSMRELTKLAEVDHIDVAIAVSMSLGDCVMHGTAAVAGRVVIDIISWVGGNRRQLRLVGHLAFLRLTYLCGMPELLGGQDVDQDRKLRPVPTMLILVSRDARVGEAVVWLLADGLTASDVHIRVRSSLVAWVDAVAAHPPAQVVLGEVVRRVAALNPRAAAAMRREPSLAVLI